MGVFVTRPGRQCTHVFCHFDVSVLSDAGDVTTKMTAFVSRTMVGVTSLSYEHAIVTTWTFH